jgi:hypothetical protein
MYSECHKQCLSLVSVSCGLGIDRKLNESKVRVGRGFPVVVIGSRLTSGYSSFDQSTNGSRIEWKAIDCVKQKASNCHAA